MNNVDIANPEAFPSPSAANINDVELPEITGSEKEQKELKMKKTNDTLNPALRRGMNQPTDLVEIYSAICVDIELGKNVDINGTDSKRLEEQTHQEEAQKKFLEEKEWFSVPTGLYLLLFLIDCAYVVFDLMLFLQTIVFGCRGKDISNYFWLENLFLSRAVVALWMLVFGKEIEDKRFLGFLRMVCIVIVIVEGAGVPRTVERDWISETMMCLFSICGVCFICAYLVEMSPLKYQDGFRVRSWKDYFSYVISLLIARVLALPFL